MNREILIEELRNREKNNPGDIWGYYKRGLKEYQNLILPVIKEPILSILQKKKEKNLPLVFDCMGFGYVIRDICDKIPVKGISLALSQSKDIDEPNIAPIEGDILNKNTWEKVNNQIKKWSYSGFDLVFWLPSTGFHPSYFTESVLEYNMILQKIWQLLSNNNGILFAEIPYFVSKHHPSIFNRWKEQVQLCFGESAGFHCPIDKYRYLMRLEKTLINQQDKLPDLIKNYEK